jgi:hypothetical protein
MTDKPTLSPAARAALIACFATRGINKGRLLSKAPSPFKPETRMAHAAWHGAMLACNAFKAGVFSLMLLDKEQRAIADEVTAYMDARPGLAKVCDRDRDALEKLGVW